MRFPRESHGRSNEADSRPIRFSIGSPISWISLRLRELDMAVSVNSYLSLNLFEPLRSLSPIISKPPGDARACPPASAHDRSPSISVARLSISPNHTALVTPRRGSGMRDVTDPPRCRGRSSSHRHRSVRAARASCSMRSRADPDGPIHLPRHPRNPCTCASIGHRSEMAERRGEQGCRSTFGICFHATAVSKRTISSSVYDRSGCFSPFPRSGREGREEASIKPITSDSGCRAPCRSAKLRSLSLSLSLSLSPSLSPPRVDFGRPVYPAVASRCSGTAVKTRARARAVKVETSRVASVHSAVS